MVTFPLLAVGFLMNLVMVIFVICAVVLILVVLIQKGKGGGLSGAFGGGGGAGGLLGTKTGDFLTWFTIGLAALFLLLSVVMAKFYRPSVGEYGTEPAQQTSVPVEQQAPAGQADINLPAE